MNSKIAIYMRVSTTSQSVELQERDLTNYCQMRGLDIYKKYVDKVSGTKEKRPELNLLMNDAYKRKFDTVLVWRFDRFARSVRHLTLALEEFQSIDINFISYQENIDTSTPMGKAMFTIISAMAQLEKDLIKERVKSGIANARAKGKKLGRPKTRNDEKIRSLKAKGYSYRQIAEQLNTSLGSVQRALKAPLREGLPANSSSIQKA